MSQPLIGCTVDQLCRATRKLQCSIPELVVHASLCVEGVDIPGTLRDIESFKKYEKVPPVFPGAPIRVFRGWEQGEIYGPVAVIVQSVLQLPLAEMKGLRKVRVPIMV